MCTGCPSPSHCSNTTSSGSRLALRFFLVLLLMATVGLFRLAAQELKVGVLPMSFTGESPQLEALSTTIPNTVSLTLKFIEGYDVRELPHVGIEAREKYSPEELSALCEQNGLDLLIYGSETAEEGGGFRFTLSVYGAQRGSSFIEKSEEASGILDVFSTADSLTEKLLGELSDTRIAFGSLFLSLYGEPVDYLLYVDEEQIGKNVSSIEKLLTGERDVELLFSLPEGKRRYQRTLTVEEEKLQRLHVPYPLLTKEQQRHFAEMDIKIFEEGTTILRRPQLLERLQAAQRESRQLELSPSRNYFAEKYEHMLDFWDTETGERTFSRRAITVDGKVNDWLGMKSSFFDKPNYSVLDNPGSDIEWAKVATDWSGKKLFLALKTADGTFNTENEYKVYMNLGIEPSARNYDSILVISNEKTSRVTLRCLRVDKNENYHPVSLSSSQWELEIDGGVIEASLDIDSIGSRKLRDITGLKIEKIAAEGVENRFSPRSLPLDIRDASPAYSETRSMKKPNRRSSTPLDHLSYRLAEMHENADLQAGGFQIYSGDIPKVQNDWFELDGSLRDWAHVPPLRAKRDARFTDPAARISYLSIAQDDTYYYLMLELDGKPSIQYGYQLQIYDIKSDSHEDIGATLVNTRYEEGKWKTKISEDWWNNNSRNTEISDSSFACGVEEVVETRFPKSVIRVENEVAVDYVIYRSGGDFLRERIEKFNISQ